MKCLSEMMVFARVVDSGGFSAAARALGTTTSAISRNISRLEAHIGGRLLNRTTRALSVTELGRDVHAACLRIERTSRELDAFASQHASTPNGHLKVGVPASYGYACIIPSIARFLRRYPDVTIQLELVERVPDLFGEPYDLAICIDATPPASLTAQALSSYQQILVASPQYLERAGEPLDAGDLDTHTFISTRTEANGAGWRLCNNGREHRIAGVSRLFANNDSALVRAACEGMGVGLVPDYAARDALECGQLTQLLSDWKIERPTGTIVHAVYAPTRHVPRKIAAFISFFTGSTSALKLAA